MKISSKVKQQARIEMLPLIDIVFLLLVFFIYAMLSMSVHGGRQVDLPTSKMAGKTPDEPITVTLEKKEAKVIFHINGQQVDEEAFIPILQNQGDILKAEGKESAVQLFADRAMSYQQVYQTLDSINRAGFAKVFLQAQPADQ